MEAEVDTALLLPQKLWILEKNKKKTLSKLISCVQYLLIHLLNTILKY